MIGGGDQVTVVRLPNDVSRLKPPVPASNSNEPVISKARHSAFAATVRGEGGRWFPGVVDGLRTMRFIEAVIANAASDRKWSPLYPGETE